MFSKATEYALRATIYIAQNSSEEKKIGIRAMLKLSIPRNHSQLKFCSY
jgi:DNA-binding IscR family transcriptional regulator